MTIEEAIVRLEDSLRRLKVQYEMFFAGSLKRQPLDLRREVEQIIHTHSNTAIRNYAHRFQFNTLVSRYNALFQYWTKQLRTREEGGRAAGLGTQSAPHPKLTGRSAGGEAVLFHVRISNPEADTESMRALYEQYLQAKHAGGGDTTPLKLESFVKQVSMQASDLLETAGCSSIEFRILKNGDSVSLRARPATQESKA